MQTLISASAVAVIIVCMLRVSLNKYIIACFVYLLYACIQYFSAFTCKRLTATQYFNYTSSLNINVLEYSGIDQSVAVFKCCKSIEFNISVYSYHSMGINAGGVYNCTFASAVFKGYISVNRYCAYFLGTDRNIQRMTVHVDRFIAVYYYALNNTIYIAGQL